jgi:hypothetical protein
VRLRLAEHLPVSSGFDSSVDCRQETVTVTLGVVGANTTTLEPSELFPSTSTPSWGVITI